MEFKDILLDIREWNKWMKERFLNKDFITLEQLLGDYEDLIDKVEDLKDQIDRLEHPDDGSDELYEAWKDYYS